MTDGPRIVCTIQHPAHVHFFRNAIAELEGRGYDVRVFAREADVVEALLEYYDVDYRLLAGRAESTLRLLAVQARYEYEILRRVRDLDPAALLAIAEPSVAHASRFVDGRSVLFTDTEHATLSNAIAFPFADLVCTPAAFRDDLGAGHRTYRGYHELAYLHPDRYAPDPTIGDDLGVDDGERLVVLRLVAWNAVHDVGRSGIERAGIERVVAGLERAGARVLVSAEGALPPSLADRRVDLPPHRMHDLLARADLFLGESATMAIESAVLGTPALYVADFDAGVLAELETRYRLLRKLPRETSPTELVRRARALLRTDDAIWARRRRDLLEETIDTTAFVVETVEEVVDDVPAEVTAR